MKVCPLCGEEFEPIPLHKNNLRQKVCLECIARYNLSEKMTDRQYFLSMAFYGAEYGLKKPTFYKP